MQNQIRKRAIGERNEKWARGGLAGYERQKAKKEQQRKEEMEGKKREIDVNER